MTTQQDKEALLARLARESSAPGPVSSLLAPLRAARRTLWQLGRYGLLYLVNYPLRRWVISLTRPEFLFAIYGTDRQARAYYATWLEPLVPAVGIAGLVRVLGRRGFVVGTRFVERELCEEQDKLEAYVESLRDAFPTVKRIALVGRLPTLARRAGIAIDGPFVDGATGTRFLIRQVARDLRELPQARQRASIAVLGGAGRIGSAVCDDLLSLFPRVIAFDPRYPEDRELQRAGGTILQTSLPEALGQARLFIALTDRGDALADLAAFLPEGSLVADDTHPPIGDAVRETLRARGVEVRKAVLAHDGFSIRPRMPSWSRGHVPGCVVEALVLLSRDGLDPGDLEAFEKAALDFGFYGALEQPIDD